MVKKLTLEDRRKIEQMWKDNASPLKIAAELGISQCTVYTELKRGQKTDEWTGETVLDHNFRPEYKAERGEKTYQSNLRKRGRRPKAAPSMKGAYQHTATTSACNWWLRSVNASNTNSFCLVNADGSATSAYAYSSLGFAPGFIWPSWATPSCGITLPPPLWWASRWPTLPCSASTS